MELKTIGQVSKGYGISVRMLRYYEKEGLLNSQRKENYAYRVYDESAIHRLRQIIILRKLRIPVKQIKNIFNNHNARLAIDIFEKNIGELDEEITALSTIRGILKQLVDELQNKANITVNLEMLTDPSTLPLVDSLPFKKNQLNGDLTMDALNKASDVLNKLRNVRVIYLPPMTVASAFFTGEAPRIKAWLAITNFVEQGNLLEIKPDLRIFMIDHSNAIGENFGFEIWVSIPEDFEVAAPLVKKNFLGGQYAAHFLGDEDGFSVALGLQDWINESDIYQYDISLNRTNPPMNEINSFGGRHLSMDEVLNFYNDQSLPSESRLDALVAIKNYTPIDEMPVAIPGIEEKCGYKGSVAIKSKFKVFGFTRIMTSESGSPEDFISDLKANGQLDIINKFRKPGAHILGYGSHDMDSAIRGGWRFTVCLHENDITDLAAFSDICNYYEKVDASRWLIFETTRGEDFDGHGICMKVGYTWNSIISGSFMAYPEDTILINSGCDTGTVYCWYPIK